MTDYSKMSNEELLQRAGIKKPDYSAMSNEELLKKAGLHKDYSLLDRAKQVGHGVKATLKSIPLGFQEHLAKGRWGVGQEAEHPELMAKTEAKLKKISQPLGKDSTARILHKIGEFGSATLLPIPGTGILKGTKAAAEQFKLGNGILKHVKNDSLAKILHKTGALGSAALVPTKQLGLGSGIGAGAGALEEAGVDPLTANLTAALTPAGASVLKNAGISHRLKGLSPKKLKLPLAEAAQRQGIDLPAAVLSDSALLGGASQVVSKTPFFGDVLNAKYAESGNKIKHLLGDVKKTIGPEKDEAWNAVKDALYQKQLKHLPKNAVVMPVELVNELKGIRSKIRGFKLHPDSKEIVGLIDRILKSTSPSATVQKMFDKTIAKPVFVEDLIGQKQQLNMNYADVDSGVKQLRNSVNKAIGNELERYGQTPEAKKWFEAYQAAQKHYGKGAAREKFENMLGNVGGKDEMEHLHYKTLFNKLSNRKNQKALNRIIAKSDNGDVLSKKLKDLATLASGMGSAKLPNPSGTAPLNEAIRFTKKLGTMATVGSAAFAPAEVTGALGIMGALSYLVTSKRLVNSAIKFARKPSGTLAKRLNNIAKTETGLTLPILNQMFNEK